MRHLQTYFALLTMLLTLLATLLVCQYVVIVLGAADARLFLMAIPLAIIALLIGMVLGHHLAEPFRSLALRIRDYRQTGQLAELTGGGQTEEAERLAQEVKSLIDSSKAQQADLTVLEKRQSEFVSDVAHELRTPLTAIHGDAELLADPDLPPEMHEKFCKSILRESERLSRLTNDLLSLQNVDGKVDTSQWRRIDLKHLVHGMLDALAPVLEQRQAHVSVEGEAPDVLGSADALEQVVGNLVDNASRFIEPGGHITIELAGIEGNSVIAVKDDGSGFGDVDPHLLFGRFYRTDYSRSRDTGGSGLGLAIVKSIVEAHDGSVEAYNLSEGGACFLVALLSIQTSA